MPSARYRCVSVARSPTDGEVALLARIAGEPCHAGIGQNHLCRPLQSLREFVDAAVRQVSTYHSSGNAGIQPTDAISPGIPVQYHQIGQVARRDATDFVLLARGIR